MMKEQILHYERRPAGMGFRKVVAGVVLAGVILMLVVWGCDLVMAGMWKWSLGRSPDSGGSVGKGILEGLWWAEKFW